jgi:hypothetical protein
MAWSCARSQAAPQSAGRNSAYHAAWLAGNGCPPAPGWLVPGSRSVRRCDGFALLFWAVPAPLAGRDCGSVWQAAVAATRGEGRSAGGGAGACTPAIRMRIRQDAVRQLCAGADPLCGWRDLAWSGAMARARHGRQGVARSLECGMPAGAGASPSAGAAHLPRPRRALRAGQCARGGAPRVPAGRAVADFTGRMNYWPPNCVFGLSGR